MSQEIELFQKMYEHTHKECAQCKIPFNCCSKEYCEMTIAYARDQYGLELKRTGHPTLPLMGDEGCIAEPHLRPLCTLHTCQINAFGAKIADPQWTDIYWNLREKIEEISLDICRRKN